ncbi:hypothetical protein JHK84_057111 [Glycine max]|nr:hypothetical protein JHK84_057111 [Glycine max]
MSKAPLLLIEPKELKFIFELKKQSSCSVQLTNNTNHYVAFKIKTTSPKKYSVRPNVGVLAPKATCEFIGTTVEDESTHVEINSSILVSVTPSLPKFNFHCIYFVIKQLQCNPKGKHLKIWCARTSS